MALMISDVQRGERVAEPACDTPLARGERVSAQLSDERAERERHDT